MTERLGGSTCLSSVVILVNLKLRRSILLYCVVMACIKYSRQALLTIGSSLTKSIRIQDHTWSQLKYNGIKFKSIRRGCRGGAFKERPIKSSVGFGKYSISSFLTRATQGISESFPNVHKHRCGSTLMILPF
jgi:hypothetical protein